MRKGGQQVHFKPDLILLLPKSKLIKKNVRNKSGAVGINLL